jgi:hypothetical protein
MPSIADGAAALGALMNRSFGLAAVVISQLLVGVVGACGSSPSVVSKGATGSDALGDAGNEALGGSAGDDGSTSMGDALNVGADNGVGDASVPVGVTELKLEVSIDKDLVLVTGTPIDVAAHAQYEDGSLPKSVVWSVDDTRIGSISQDGVFEANGYSAGAVTITAQAGSESASVPFAVAVKLSQNPDNISAADQAQLVLGGTGGGKGIGPDAAFRFLYPYDNTVFPRGLSAPALQFGGAAASSVYLKITTTNFSYAGFSAAGTPTRITLPDSVWKGLTDSAGGSDAVKVQVSELVSGVVTGPIEEQWSIAQGSLKGVVYYNTYRSLLAGSDGAVMRIRPGGTAEVLQKGCTVCHSVSAQGNVLVAGVDWDQQTPVDSEALTLAADGSTKPLRIVSEGRLFALGALTPDGKRLLSNGAATTGPLPRGFGGPFASQLVDVKTGTTIAAPSFTDKVTYALTPIFSPDGAHVAFNNRDVSAGHTLSMMDYDGSTTPPTFSKLRDVFVSPSKVVAWPSFLPDGNAILFHEGDAFDTSLYQGGPLYADLRLVGTDASPPKQLAQLNGYDANGVSYLPYGDAEEGHLDYEPSVLPVPVGGYYWVLFTSRRTYGNTISPDGTVARGNDKWGKPQGDEVESPSPRKKIWLAPIDVNYNGKVDPSHPAIYLPGQELESGNMRAFAALEPCRANGGSCESAAECCNGFCRQTGNDATGPILECVPPPENACSNEDEACGVADDCCDKLDLCINKRCATPTPDAPPK